MNIHLSKNQVLIGDTLKAIVKFTNKSPDTLQFYPDAIFFLAETPQGFHTRTKTIDAIVNRSVIEKVNPNRKYETTKIIIADSTFFKPGPRTYKLIYGIRETQKEPKDNAELCGGLATPEFRLEVLK